jgi:hypothetical protein
MFSVALSHSLCFQTAFKLLSNCFPFIAHFAVTITTYFTFLKICISLFARPAPAMSQIPTRTESNWTDVPTEKINAKV